MSFPRRNARFELEELDTGHTNLFLLRETFKPLTLDAEGAELTHLCGAFTYVLLNYGFACRYDRSRRIKFPLTVLINPWITLMA